MAFSPNPRISLSPRCSLGLVRVVTLVGALALFSVACVQLDDTELEPLRGLEDQTTTTRAGGDEVAAGDDESETDGEVAGEVVDGDGVAGHDGRPFEELDLPPDEPPPPVEPGGQQPAQPPAPVTTTPPPPPAPTNFDPASLAAVGSYCELWQIYGSIGEAIDRALFIGPPAHTAEVLSFAAPLHRRAGELSSERRGDHNQVADVFVAIDELLGEHGHDFTAFINAAENDPTLLQRLAAIEAPAGAPMERIDAHVASACGVTLG